MRITYIYILTSLYRLYLSLLDDEEVLREELKDLIDDRPIEESDGEDSDGSGREKRKKSDDEEYDDRLEDEDYDLIEENLGVKVERRKFKRLRRIQDEESDGEEHQDETQDREAIAMDLFSDDVSLTHFIISFKRELVST